MKKRNIIIVSLALMLTVIGFNTSSMIAAPTKAPVKPAQATKTVTKPATTVMATSTTYTYYNVKSLDLVKNPSVYVNKRVRIRAKFDKFSSLGLDYKPALRSSDKYIAFLIRRDDVSNDIPLSEMKNFMKRELAEKFIDLETNDVVEYTGLVFSDALGDVWVDVDSFKIISAKPKKTENKTSLTKTK